MGGWCVEGTLKATGFKYPYDPEDYCGYGDYVAQVPEVFLRHIWNGCTQRTGNSERDDVAVLKDNTLTVFTKRRKYDYWIRIGNKTVLCKEEDVPIYCDFTDAQDVPVDEYRIEVFDLKTKTKKVFKTVLEEEDVPYREYETHSFTKEGDNKDESKN